jgi:hypothetical protein
MENVPITYLGLAVCLDARIVQSDAAGARIATREPMPVGTEIEVTLEGNPRRARVTSVSEVVEPGMQVAFADEPAETKPKRRKRKPEG